MFRSVRRSLLHLVGLGLIPFGLLDKSFLPLPGILDVATTGLSAPQQKLWLHYAIMSTAGSVIGGLVTYRFARKGGKDAPERRFSRKRIDQVCEIFGQWEFAAIAVPAVLPPPVPLVRFLLAAGARQYPVRKFLAVLTLGRISRYLLLSYLRGMDGKSSPSWGAWAPGCDGHRHVAAGRCHGGRLLPGREKEKELATKLNRPFF